MKGLPRHCLRPDCGGQFVYEKYGNRIDGSCLLCGRPPVQMLRPSLTDKEITEIEKLERNLITVRGLLR